MYAKKGNGMNEQNKQLYLESKCLTLVINGVVPPCYEVLPDMRNSSGKGNGAKLRYKIFKGFECIDLDLTYKQLVDKLKKIKEADNIHAIT